MGISSVVAAVLCILACICSLQAVTTATKTKILHIIHYTHEIRGGPNATLLLAAGTNSDNVTAGATFGSILVYDNAITETPSNTSKVVGRAAGVAIGVIKPSATTDGHTRVQVQMEHIFQAGSKYPDSSLSVVGIFLANVSPWEADVVGGTGVFKEYRGYAVATQLQETALPTPVYVLYKWDFYLSRQN